MAGVGQQPHVRDKGLEVGVAPQVEPFDAGDGRRVLPEVEVVVPFGRGREFPADDRESDVECSELPPFCIHFYRRSVLSGGGVGRDGYRYPHRTDASGLYVENLDVVEHVRNQVRRVDRRIVIAAFVAELIAQDIADACARPIGTAPPRPLRLPHRRRSRAAVGRTPVRRAIPPAGRMSRALRPGRPNV